MAKRDNSVKFTLTTNGIAAFDAAGKEVIRVDCVCRSHDTDRKKFAAIRVFAAGQWIDITATPTTVNVTKRKASTERKETKR